MKHLIHCRSSIANSRTDTKINNNSASNRQVKKQARNSVGIVDDSIIKQVGQRKMSSDKTVKVSLSQVLQ